MKKAVFLFTVLLFGSMASALPEGGITCKNRTPEKIDDGYMEVSIRDGKASFSYWETFYENVTISAMGKNTFAVVEEEAVGVGEGTTWKTTLSAFMVYHPSKNQLTVSNVMSEDFVRHEVLFCN